MAEYIEKWSVVNRLIDIENEFQQYKPFHGYEHAMYRKICEAEIAIGKTQAADVVPVRHGRWLRSDDDWDSLTSIRCSICGEEWCFEMIDDVTLLNYKYCPNCGAKMDRGTENATD